MMRAYEALQQIAAMHYDGDEITAEEAADQSHYNDTSDGKFYKQMTIDDAFETCQCVIEMARATIKEMKGGKS